MKSLVLLMNMFTLAASAQKFAYIGNFDAGGGVSVIDTGANQLVATIPTDAEVFHIELSPDGAQAWVAILSIGEIEVIDTATNTVVTRIVLPSSGAQRIAFTPDGKRAYVAAGLGVFVFDAHTYALLTTISGSELTFRLGMAFTADGRRLYVSQPNLDSITVIDAKSNTVTGTLMLPAQSDPRGITLSHKGDRIYVANAGTATVSVFSTFDNHPIASIPVGSSPIEIALTPGDDRAYVTDGGDNTVAIIDTASNSVVNTIAVVDAEAIAITQDGTRAYITNGFDATVSVVDLALNQITSTISVVNLPFFMTLGKNVARLNVGLANSDDVGIRFDLRAEVYRNGTQLLGSGQLSSMAGGSSGFDNSVGLSVPLSLGVPAGVASGDTISVRLLVRNACAGSGKNSGRARLWYGDANADSRFDVISAAGIKTPYYLGFGVLETSAGSGPRRSIDVAAGAKCSDFKEFGTWSRVLP